MSLRYDSLADLPPGMREKAAGKLLRQAAEKADVSRSNEQTGEKRAKYGNREAHRGEIRFDSQKEARRFDELLSMLRAGKIRDLKLQHEFVLVEGYRNLEGQWVRPVKYRADFTYLDAHGRMVVEDVKSRATKTRVYEIKKRLLRERRGIEIVEV